ncbi:MAG: toxin [Proteobacteria bacterium]|nr:toxin [Pseudomonadota bacterium]
MKRGKIRWDVERNLKSQVSGGISFEEIMALIEAGSYYPIAHPTRENQYIAVVMVAGYPWDVPFVIEEDGTVFLKTAFPNRKRK